MSVEKEPWSENGAFRHTCFQVSFSDFLGSESGRLGLEKHKNSLSAVAENGFLLFQVPFFTFLGGLGPNFNDFCCPGDWLKV